MLKRIFLAAAAAAMLPAAAFAQDTTTDATATATAPDGTPAFGIEPYFGVLGGYHSFDRDSEFGTDINGGRFKGWTVGGVVGVNIPLGAVFVGAEGNAAYGFNDVDWEYGVKGRAGIRAGDSGLVYASAGYQWINAENGFRDQKGWMYGAGVEVGPSDIGLGGITGGAGPRIRLEMNTYDFDSLSPKAGVIFHF
jgi:outer membrane immunogenic protein